MTFMICIKNMKSNHMYWELEFSAFQVYVGLAFPLPLQALLTVSCGWLEWSAAEGDPLFCSSISAIWADGMPRMTVNLPLESHEALWSSYLLTAENQWTLIFPPGSRQGCALASLVFYLSFWSMIFPSSPFRSWDAILQRAACAITHHLGRVLQTTSSSQGPQLHLAVKFKGDLVYLQEWQWK